jgi:hypothetical protein
VPQLLSALAAFFLSAAAAQAPVDSLDLTLEPAGPSTYLASEVLVVAGRPERFDAFAPDAVAATGLSVSRALAFAAHASAGDYGTSAFPSIRGLPAEHVSVEYDGIPLNSVQNGTFDLALLDLLGSGVSMTRGPFAWLGASGTSSAALVLEAREPAGPEISALTGSEGGALRIGMGDARRSLSFTALGGDGPRDGASLAGWSCRGAAATGAGDLGLAYLDARRGLPGSSDAPWSAGVLDDEIALARFRFREVGRTRPTLYATRHEQRYEDAYAAPTHVVSSFGGVLAADVTREGPVRSLVAATYDWSVLDSHDPMTTDIGRRTRGSGSVVARATAGQRALRAAAQCGVTRTTDFGTAGSGALGVAAVGSRGRAWASVGTTYRAPTMNELHWPADAWTEGNEDLDPERVVTTELGGAAVFGPVTLGVTAYRSRAANLIVWMDSGGVWRPENVGTAVLEGVEADASARAGAVTVSYAGDFASALDEGSGLDLPYRPRVQHTLSADAVLGRARVEVRARRADRVYVDAANSQTLAGYTVADASVTLDLPVGGVSAVVEVLNLFGEPYATRKGYELSGRAWRAGLLITQMQNPR